MNTRLRSVLAVFILAGTSTAWAQGDNCSVAVSVIPGTHFADGPATGAGANALCFGSFATNADWYVYTPAANGTIDVQSCGYNTDTRLSVFGGSCAALTCLGFADDSCPMCTGCAGFASNVVGLPVVAGQNYYIQWDDYWTPIGFNWDLNFHCAAAPQSTENLLLDCANGVFYIDITITNMGSATSVDITNDGGAPTLSAVGLGTHTIGPFLLGTVVQYVLVNNGDPGCDYFSVDITNFPCPFLSCGPDNYAYCYGNGENTYYVYQGTGTFPLAILFNAGGIYQFDGDMITIYDGLDQFSPILFQGNNGGNLAGLFFLSTNPSHALTLQITSDAFTSCADFGLIPMDWTVGCLDCNPPVGTFDVVLDCANNQFYVEVDLTSLGTDPAIDIINDAGAPPINVTSPGIYQAGPFPDGTITTITLVNDSNSLCNVESPLMYNFPCPIVSCGPDQYTYCYTNSDSSAFVYQSASTYPIALIFNAGAMYQWDNDMITIYDGLNAFSPIMYQGDNFGLPFDGMLFTSTNPDNALTLQVNSDQFTSCIDFGLTPFDYSVSCLDCTNPGGTFTLVPDCPHREYSILLDLDSTGSAAVVDVVNSVNTDTVQNLAAGLHTIGPFPMDTAAQLIVLNGDNPLCRIYSPAFNYFADSCTIVSCGVDNYNYCYVNDDDAWYVYQADGPYPITISFMQGDMLVDDKIIVYNGDDDFSALIYQGNAGGDLTGLALNSSNPENILALRVLSNGTGSCFDGAAADEMLWWVGCGLVGIGEQAPGAFALYPNPTDGTLNLELGEQWSGPISVQVTDLAGRAVIDQQVNAVAGSVSKIDLSSVQDGNYIVQLITDKWVKARQIQVAR